MRLKLQRDRVRVHAGGGRLGSASAPSGGHAHADDGLLAQVANPQSALPRREAVDLCMGRTLACANRDFALAFDLPRYHPERAGFHLALTAGAARSLRGGAPVRPGARRR